MKEKSGNVPRQVPVGWTPWDGKCKDLGVKGTELEA